MERRTPGKNPATHCKDCGVGLTSETRCKSRNARCRDCQRAWHTAYARRRRQERKEQGLPVRGVALHLGPIPKDMLHCIHCGTILIWGENINPLSNSGYICRDCRRETHEKWRDGNRDYTRYSNQRCIHELKMEMIAAYGGECACCGEKAHEFLTIDHIFNDGAKERRAIGGGAATWRRLRQKGWPKDRYQLLCYNCNCAKRRGYCPHKIGSMTFEERFGPTPPTPGPVQPS